jgi:hypothetical protein
MTQAEIKALFTSALNQRGLVGKVPGITKDMIYHWRKGITEPTIGDMLGVLYELQLISVQDNG